MQVRRLEEKTALRRPIATGSKHPVSVDEVLALDQRTIPRVHDRPGPQLVGREKISQYSVTGAVELCDGSKEELSGELIRRPAVQDMESVYALGGLRAVKHDTLIRDSLR